MLLVWKSFLLPTAQVQSSHCQMEAVEAGTIRTLLEHLSGQRSTCAKHQDIMYPFAGLKPLIGDVRVVDVTEVERALNLLFLTVFQPKANKSAKTGGGCYSWLILG